MSKSIQLKDKNNEKYYPLPCYPVGRLILSMDDINPSCWYGGTWVLMAKGCTLVGVNPDDIDFNASGKTGGEKTHTLTEAEMPRHRHKTVINFGGSELLDGYSGYSYQNGSRYYNDTSWAGENKPHNNMPPYFTCYIWGRVA